MNVTEPATPVAAPGTLPLTPEKEAEQRQRVVAAVKLWVGTPYRQMGYTRGKQGAVDCSMLLVAAWVDAGVVLPFDPRPYPSDWHLHRSEERYLAWMEKCAKAVWAPQPGDVVLYRFGRCFSHGGVVIDGAHIVHAFVKDKICSIGRTDQAGFNGRPRIFFDIWAKLREQQ